jgi:hypothetical protein
LIKFLNLSITTISDKNLLPVESNKPMWGGSEVLTFRSVMWSKRLEILSYITNMIQQF